MCVADCSLMCAKKLRATPPFLMGNGGSAEQQSKAEDHQTAAHY